MHSEHPVTRTLKIMRRFRSRDDARDAGNWRGMSDICSAVGQPKEAVRGCLVKLIAGGHVEASQVSNGVFYRAFRAREEQADA